MADPKSDPIPAAQLSFEAALAELEAIVRRLEEGSLDLEAAIAAYERGAALRQQCERRLAEAQLRVERIALGPAGPVAEPFA